MDITIFGANGGIGRMATNQSLDAGHLVTAVIRNPVAFNLTHPALTLAIVPGLTDPEVLRPTLKTADAVISAVGPRGRKAGTIASSSTRAILRAMELEGVRRIVAISAVPVGPIPDGESFLNRRLLLPLFGALLRDLYTDLAKMEEEFRRSASEWTVIRPPKLVNNPMTGIYRTVIGGNVPRGYAISRADSANAMITALDNLATIRQPIGIAY